MNRHIGKKLHKKYISDIVYEVSVSSFWRDRLFKAGTGEKFLIDRDNLQDFTKDSIQAIVANNLSFVVSLDESYKGSEKRFVFSAKDYMTVCADSYNNPSVV